MVYKEPPAALLTQSSKECGERNYKRSLVQAVWGLRPLVQDMRGGPIRRGWQSNTREENHEQSIRQHWA